MMVQSGTFSIDSFVNIVYSVAMLLNVRGKISCGWSFTLKLHSLELALFPGSPPKWRRPFVVAVQGESLGTRLAWNTLESGSYAGNVYEPRTCRTQFLS